MQGIFHVHSRYSHDGRCALAELVSFCRGKGLGFIAMSEHAEDLDEAVMGAFTSECTELSRDGVIVAPGLEFGFSEYPGLHLLGIGITEYIPPVDISRTIGLIQGQGGLAVIAHPARNGHFIPEHVKGRLNGIEVWNAAYDSRYLPHHKSISLYRELKRKNGSMLAFGGLDLHGAGDFKELVISVEGSPAGAAELVDLMREGRFTNRGKLFSLGSRQEPGCVARAGIRLGRLFLERADMIITFARRKRCKTII